MKDNTIINHNREIVTVCRQLYHKGLLAGADGNVSVKVGDKIITTPSGAHKGFMQEDDLVVTDLTGRIVEGNGTPSSELAMHLAIYEADPECGAVVHTHAPNALALSVAGTGFDTGRLAEAEMLLGEVPEAPYAPPGTEELARSVASCVDRGPVIMLQKHGAVSRGRNLMEAFCLMECLEHNARILLMVEILENRRAF